MSFAAFESEVAKINDLLCSANLLIWDLRTMMPPTGSQARGKQLGTPVGLARDIATGDAMSKSIEGARRELSGAPCTDLRLRAVEQAASAIDRLGRVPARL